MKALSPNSMIQNRYLIVQLIGKGGMGEVYLAVDQRLGSAVALKRTFFNENETLGNAFEREARILARLRHPVLPKVIDHFLENGDQFLVMEHISGDDLAKRLESANKPFPLTWVMFWADQMLDALNYLHSHEPPIIHRDIKPQNLKLTDDNHIVLLDFGLSKDFDTNSIGEAPTTGSVVGYSPHFASMEQVRGTGTDARSDIYSLSATLYQLLTNTVPPDALARADVLLGGIKDSIIPLNELNAEIPAEISDVILKGISVRQDERFTTATEMQKALRRAFNHGKTGGVTKASPETPVASVPTASAPPADAVDASETTTKTHMDIGGTTMDATVHMDEMPATLVPRQADVKTEVFTADTLARDKIADQEAVPAAKADEPRPPAAAAAAAAAVPAPPPPSQPRPTPVAANAPAARSGSSKKGIVIGGLAALLVLVVAAGGAGWVYFNYYRAAVPSATPAPTPVSTIDAVPTPTVTVVAESTPNADNSDQTTAATPTPDDPVGPRATPQVTTKTTPVRPSQSPAVKATPKTKPRDDRTVIIQ